MSVPPSTHLIPVIFDRNELGQPFWAHFDTNFQNFQIRSCSALFFLKWSIFLDTKIKPFYSISKIPYLKISMQEWIKNKAILLINFDEKIFFFSDSGNESDHSENYEVISFGPLWSITEIRGFIWKWKNLLYFYKFSILKHFISLPFWNFHKKKVVILRLVGCRLGGRAHCVPPTPTLIKV